MIDQSLLDRRGLTIGRSIAIRTGWGRRSVAAERVPPRTLAELVLAG